MEKVRTLYNDIVQLCENEMSLDLTGYKEDIPDNVDSRLIEFYNLLENSDLFSLFLNQKIKVFSSKTEETNNLSNSLFDEDMSLKRILNNRTDILKCKVWYKLFSIYLEMEKNNKNRDDRINSVQMIIDEQIKQISSHVKQNIFSGTDMNDTTSNMIEDIVGSLQNSMSSSGNPFENIMDITSKITEKYQGNIENGDIEIDKLLGNITSSVPMFQNMGMGGKKKEKEQVVMDENFSTADVEVSENPENDSNGMNIGNILNMTKNMPDLGNLSNIVNSLTNVQSEDDIQNIKYDMNNMLSSIGIDTDDLTQKMEELNKKFSKKD